MVFTKAGHIISAKTEALTSLAHCLLEQLHHHLPLICLFSKDRFLPAAEPQTERHIVACHLNHIIWPVWFGS